MTIHDKKTTTDIWLRDFFDEDPATDEEYEQVTDISVAFEKAQAITEIRLEKVFDK